MTEFDIVKLPLHPGDCFYFLTDGLSDNLAEACLMNMRDFDAMTKTLTELAAWKGIKDDCTAICIKINGAPHQYSFSGMDDMEKHQPEIRRALRSLAGEKALHLEIALNEAVNNVLLHGSGQGCVRIRKIGARIILRVKDLYKGFNAEAVFKPYETQPASEIAEKICFQENGRGVLLMKLFTDKILYNRSGSEIMLISRIVQSPKETGPVHAKG